MKCLIVGGTGFLGGAIADAVASAGHKVTILSRGKTPRSFANGIDVIRADRYDDLSAIEGKEFQWVFDSCAYTPEGVHKLLDAVGTQLERYVLISSLSAYGTFEKRGITESYPALAATDKDLAVARSVPATSRASASAYGSSYGALKRSCEIVAADRLNDMATNLRVGLLVGAGDYTDRLTWWARRIDQAHGPRRRVPAPGPMERAVQIIDVRDAALFALHSAELELAGVWNVIGRPMPLSQLLDRIISVTKSKAEMIWIKEDALIEAGVRPWTDMPLMAPVTPEFRHFLEIDSDQAFDAGLQCRPLQQTLTSLIAWDRSRRDQQLKCGLTLEQEVSLLH